MIYIIVLSLLRAGLIWIVSEVCQVDCNDIAGPYLLFSLLPQILCCILLRSCVLLEGTKIYPARLSWYKIWMWTVLDWRFHVVEG